MKASKQNGNVPKRISLTKGRAMFMVDLMLIPVFIGVVYTGQKLHIAGHAEHYIHQVWSQWAHYHIYASILSLLFGWLHVKAHLTWYKRLFKKNSEKKSKKSKPTLILSLLFALEIITGIILLLFVEGGNSAIGMWHYKLGIAMAILLFTHTFARLRVLKKGLGWRNRNKQKIQSI